MPEERFRNFEIIQISFNEYNLLMLAGPLSTIVAEDSKYYRFIKLGQINQKDLNSPAFIYIISTILAKNVKNMKDLIREIENDGAIEVISLKSPNEEVRPGRKSNLKVGILRVKADPEDSMKFMSDNEKYRIILRYRSKLGSTELEEIKKKQGMK